MPPSPAPAGRIAVTGFVKRIQDANTRMRVTDQAPGTTGLQETRKPVAVLCTHHRIRRGAHCDADT